MTRDAPQYRYFGHGIAYGKAKRAWEGWPVRLARDHELPPAARTTPCHEWVDAKSKGLWAGWDCATGDVLLNCTGAFAGPPRRKALLRTMNGRRKQGLTRSLGVSIYDPAGGTGQFVALWRPDGAAVQRVDRRLIRSGWLDAERDGVRVHVRSVSCKGAVDACQRRPGKDLHRGECPRSAGAVVHGARGYRPYDGALAFLGAVRGGRFW